MKCPYCGSNETEVIETRDNEDLIITRRRRRCLKCDKRFTTYERIENIELYVIKKNGAREQFDREKLRRGITRAAEKTKVTSLEIEKIVGEIEKELLNSATTEIESRKIGQMVAGRLKKIDKIAYIRFASVFKEFVDIEDLHEELDKL